MYRPNLKSVALTVPGTIGGTLAVPVYAVQGLNGVYRDCQSTTSRSSKVIDFGTNQKRVCDFLLGRHSDLASLILFLSCTVSEILQVFLCS